MQERKIVHKFYSKQSDFLKAKDKYVCFAGGIGSGKTHAGATFAAKRLLENPETVGFIGANSYKQLNQATLKKLFETLDDWHLDYIYNRKPKWYKSSFDRHDGILSCRNGAQAIVRSLDNYEDIRGIELGWAWLDETRDTKKKAFDVVIGRLREKKSISRDVRITTTPNGYNWLYDMFGDENIKKNYKLITAGSWDNPFLPEGYVDSLNDMYTDEVSQQEVAGLFVNITQGRVYINFDRTASTTKPCPYEPKLGLCHAFDFNVNPMCSVIIQIHGDEIWVIDEIVLKNSYVPEACREFISRYPKPGILQVYGDASGEARTHTTGKGCYHIIRDEYMKFNPHMKQLRRNPPISDRVLNVNKYFENTTKGVSGMKIYIDPRCKSLTKTLEQLSYKENSSVVDEKSATMGNHLTDALGYFIHREFPLRPKGGALHL